MTLLRGESIHGLNARSVNWSKLRQVLVEAYLYESSVNESINKQTCLIAIENADGLFVVKPFRDDKPGVRSTWCFLSLVIVPETSLTELPAEALLDRVMSADIGEFIRSEESKFRDFVEDLKSISLGSETSSVGNQLSLSSASLANKGKVKFFPYTLRSKLLKALTPPSVPYTAHKKTSGVLGLWNGLWGLGNSRPLGRM